MINPDTPSNLTPYPPPAELDRHTETTIRQLLKAHGLLLNSARRDVLHVLLLAQHPLDVDGALAAARASGSHVSRAAVSRFLNLLNRLGVVEVAARRNARRFFRLRRETQTISLSCVQQNRIIEVQDDAVVEAVQRLLHGMGYRLAEGIHFRIEPLSAVGTSTVGDDA